MVKDIYFVACHFAQISSIFVYDVCQNIDVLNKVDSRTLAEMPKVQMNWNHTFFIREEVKILQQSVMPFEVAVQQQFTWQ